MAGAETVQFDISINAKMILFGLLRIIQGAKMKLEGMRVCERESEF